MRTRFCGRQHGIKIASSTYYAANGQGPISRWPGRTRTPRTRCLTTPTRPDQWWVAISPTVGRCKGFATPRCCVDVFSRRVLGRRVMSSKTTALVTSVPEQALFTRELLRVPFHRNGFGASLGRGKSVHSIGVHPEACTEAGIAGSSAASATRWTMR